MSRGPGRLQNAILDTVGEKGTLSFGKLCWCLAEDVDRGVTKSGDLSRTFYASCHRAVSRLVDEGKLLRVRRKLQNIAELVAHYPYKTPQKTIKDLRTRLLPHLHSYLGETKARQFGLRETERHFIAQKNSDEMQQNEKYWRGIENRLSLLLSKVPIGRRELVLDLFVRGRELFVPDSHATCPIDLGTLLRRALASSGIPKPERMVYAEIKDLYDACFPLNERRLMNLKDQLYVVVDLSKQGSGKPLLKEAFKKELLKRDPSYLTSLPGHKGEEERTIPGLEGWPFDIYFSPLLNHLIGRDSLSFFDFLTLPSVVTPIAQRV
jgi:hypothetical protein